MLANFIINSAQMARRSYASNVNGSNTKCKALYYNGCETTNMSNLSLISFRFYIILFALHTRVVYFMVNVSCYITRQLNRTLDTNIYEYDLKWKRLPKKKGKLK